MARARCCALHREDFDFAIDAIDASGKCVREPREYALLGFHDRKLEGAFASWRARTAQARLILAFVSLIAVKALGLIVRVVERTGAKGVGLAFLVSATPVVLGLALVACVLRFDRFERKGRVYGITLIAFALSVCVDVGLPLLLGDGSSSSATSSAYKHMETMFAVLFSENAWLFSIMLFCFLQVRIFGGGASFEPNALARTLTS